MTSGWDRLTRAERTVLTLTVEGLSNREIGERLHISSRTVQRHLYEIFRKVNVRSRTQLAVEALRRGALGSELDEEGRTGAGGGRT